MRETADPPRLTPSWVVGLLVADLVLSVALFAGAWAHPGTITAGGRQDAPYTIWALAWTARAVTHGVSPWATTALSSPSGVNLLANASVTGLGLLLSPVTAIFGPLVAYNVAATAALGGTAWSAQVVIRRSGVASWPAAAVGGLVAGFGPTSLVQASGGHVHVSAAFLVPPMILGVGRLATGTARSPRRWGAVLGALAAVQLLIGEELLALTVITVVTVGSGLVIAGRRVPWVVVGQGAIAAAAVFVVLAGYPLAVQFAGPAHILGPIQRGERYADDLVAFVAPVREVWFRSGAVDRLAAQSSEQGAYLGIPMIVIAVLAVARYRDVHLVRVLGLGALTAAVLSLGTRLVVAGSRTPVPLPWALLAHLPLLGSVLPVRFGILLDLAAGALLAVALDRIGTWAGSGGRRGAHHRHRPAPGGLPVTAAATLAGVCLLPMIPRLPARTTSWPVPPLFRTPAGAGVADGALVVVSPYPSPSDPQVEVWLAVAGDRWRSTGGTYFVPDGRGRVRVGGPPSAADVVDAAIEQGATARAEVGMGPGVRAGLTRDGVSAVLVGPGPHRDQVIAWWTALLGAPRSVGGMAVWTLTATPPSPRVPG